MRKARGRDRLNHTGISSYMRRYAEYSCLRLKMIWPLYQLDHLQCGCRLSYVVLTLAGVRTSSELTFEPHFAENFLTKRKLEVQSTYHSKVVVSGTILPDLRMSDLCTSVTVRMIVNLPILMLLWAILINQLLTSVHPVERKVVPYHSPITPILMSYAAGRGAGNMSSIDTIEIQKSQRCWWSQVDSALNNLTAAGQVVLNTMFRTALLVRTKNAFLAESIPQI